MQQQCLSNISVAEINCCNRKISHLFMYDTNFDDKPAGQYDIPVEESKILSKLVWQKECEIFSEIFWPCSSGTRVEHCTRNRRKSGPRTQFKLPGCYYFIHQPTTIFSSICRWVQQLFSILYHFLLPVIFLAMTSCAIERRYKDQPCPHCLQILRPQEKLLFSIKKLIDDPQLMILSNSSSQLNLSYNHKHFTFAYLNLM